MLPCPALAELIAPDREREGRPFGGWGGEWAAPPAPAAPPPTIVIPPPPWADNGEPETAQEDAP